MLNKLNGRRKIGNSKQNQFSALLNKLKNFSSVRYIGSKPVQSASDE